MSVIQVGDEAPLFTAAAHSGERIALADFRGRQAVVLFFYPQDGTPVCTAEACAFRDSHADFLAAGAMVIGVSGDSLARHRDFAERRQLPYPLLSDTDGAIRRAYGIAPMLGLFPGRVTFVIDKEGTVRHIYRALLSGQRHTTEALEVVRQLQGQNAAPKTA